MAEKFTAADTATLLAQPGYFYYRAYGSSNPWTKAVFANGAAYAPAVESVEVSFDDVGVVYDQVAKETAEISISSGRVLDFDFVKDVTGGLYTKVTTPGTPVVGANQVVNSGNWKYQTPFLIANQMGDGTAPTITSVTGSVDGALVANTDYFLIKLPEAGWAIYVKDSTTVTTELQNLTIVYNYTPAAQVKLTRGGVKVITPIELAFQTINSDGDYVQYFFYKCFSDGADGHGFGAEGSAEPITMDLKLTAKTDINRPSGDQLMSKVIGGASLG